MNDTWHPLAFFSKKLRPPENEYSAFDRELLAFYLGLQHFRYFLEGPSFVAYTYHKPLTFCMSKMSEPWSSRQQRHLSYISEFTTDIRHIRGKDNLVADTLSRANIDFIQLGIDFRGMAADQRDDPEVQALRTATSSLQAQDIPFGVQGVTLPRDTSTGHARPIVPAGWICQVFDLIHGLSHPSMQATRKLIASKFIWNGLQKQVGIWAKACIPCQTSKIQRHIKAPIDKFTVPHRRLTISMLTSWDLYHPTMVYPPPHRSGSFLQLARRHSP